MRSLSAINQNTSPTVSLLSSWLRRVVCLRFIRTVFFAEHGGLMAYGIGVDLWRRAAGYIGRILQGANPGELPIDQATKLELINNLKTAKTLGLTVPQILLAGADEVIE
jgi:ABC-type uncharacterized transport system substrate-binding protein